MKVLLVKTSSMGDVVHALTAVTEAKQQRPELRIDWLVEESFAGIAQIAHDHGDIHRVIPIRFRCWRKRKPFGIFFNPDIQRLKRQLRASQYDVVLDAQGLLKSAFLARLANAPISGFDSNSARESLAARFYTNTYSVDKSLHAIERQRLLFAQTFDYPVPEHALTQASQKQQNPKVIVFLHGTTWSNKRYPVAQWRNLAVVLTQTGYHIVIPHHGSDEKKDAQLIAQDLDNVTVLSEKTITDLRTTLVTSSAVISVDTGLAHLAVYLGIPTIMLFGPTRPELTGGIGEHTINLVGEAEDTGCMQRQHDNAQFSPSMSAIDTDTVLFALEKLTSK